MAKSKIHLQIEGDDDLVAAFKNRSPGDKMTLRSVQCELIENTEKDVVLEVTDVEVDLPAADEDGSRKPEDSDDDDPDDESMGSVISRAMQRGI